MKPVKLITLAVCLSVLSMSFAETADISAKGVRIPLNVMQYTCTPPAVDKKTTFGGRLRNISDGIAAYLNTSKTAKIASLTCTGTASFTQDSDHIVNNATISFENLTLGGCTDSSTGSCVHATKRTFKMYSTSVGPDYTSEASFTGTRKNFVQSSKEDL